MTSGVNGTCRIERACWLSDRVLLGIGSACAHAPGTRAVRLSHEAITVDGTMHSFPAVGSISDAGVGPVVIGVHLPSAVSHPDRLTGAYLVDREHCGHAVALDGRVGTVQELAPHLAELDVATRRRVLAWCLDALGESLDGERRADPDCLVRLREALRDRAPIVWSDHAGVAGSGAPTIVAIDRRSFYICGGLPLRGERPASVVAWSPEGARVDLSDLLHYQVRGSQVSVRGYVRIAAPSREPAGWVLHVTDARGHTIELRLADSEPDSPRVADVILGDLREYDLWDDDLLREHVRPALDQWRGMHLASTRVLHSTQFGVAPAASDVSVVVPLGRRLDLLEWQLADFVNDPDFAHVDLIYVLDAAASDDALTLVDQLHRLYRLPFRLVLLNGQAGTNGALNAGVARARAPHVVLMRADTVPVRPGWASALRTLYEATPLAGLLAPTLLSIDGAVEQAGLAFEWRTGPARVEAVPQCVGADREHIRARGPAPLAAASAACLMVSERLYAQVGGLDGLYLDGGMQEVELGVALHQHGRRSLHVPSVEMYHAGGQSTRRNTTEVTLYNAWRLTQRWGERAFGARQA